LNLGVLGNRSRSPIDHQYPLHATINPHGQHVFSPSSNGMPSPQIHGHHTAHGMMHAHPSNTSPNSNSGGGHAAMNGMSASALTSPTSSMSSPHSSPKHRLRSRANRQISSDLGLSSSAGASSLSGSLSAGSSPAMRSANDPTTSHRRDSDAVDYGEDYDESEEDDGLEKLIECPQCQRKFSTLQRMQTHERVHSGDKPFACAKCGARFNHRGSLTRHMRAHTGQKPHVCDSCGKSFHQPGNLTVHMRTHTGEKPFHCTECGKRFNHRSSLTVHQRNHAH
jgi:uncharacterized Zn-finger protein